MWVTFILWQLLSFYLARKYIADKKREAYEDMLDRAEEIIKIFKDPNV